MIFEDILIENFGPFYGQHRFRLEGRGLTLVMGDNQDEPRMDSNGAGKSSIFDALDWCLFGVSPRKDHADSMVNEEAFAQRGSECQVVVNLMDDRGQSWSIQRGRMKSKNTLVLRGPGGPVEALDVKATQTRIEEVLGLDREVFHAAVLFAQGDMVRYADSTDAERMSILTRILQLGEIDEHLVKAKGRVKDQEAELERLARERSSLAGQRSVLMAQNYDADAHAWEEARKSALMGLDTRMATAQAEVNQLASEIINPDHYQRQRAAAQAELDAMARPPEMPELTAARERLQAQQLESRTVAGQLHAAQVALQKVEATGEGVCPECGQQITGAHLASERERLAESVAAFQGAAQMVAGQVQQATEVVRQLEGQYAQLTSDWQTAREAKTREIVSLDAQIRDISGKQAAVQRAQAEVARLQAEYAAKESEVNPFHAREAQRQDQLHKLDQVEAETRQAETKVQDDLRYLEFWVTALGPKGLKSYILDNRLAEMNTEVNRWVRLLTGGTIWVQFEAQKQTRSKKLVNAPAIRVCRWNPDGTTTERNYESWSGGEKQRISFAVDFGLSRLIASRARNRYDMMILDEVFKHLDRSGKEAVVEMLQALSRERGSMFVVEHDDEFKGAFENRVKVVKRNMRSTIQEDDNGKAHPETEAGPDRVPGHTAPKRRPVRTPVRRPVATE